MQLAPFLIPGLGFGRYHLKNDYQLFCPINANCVSDYVEYRGTLNSTRFTLGGGLALTSRVSGFSAGIGFQRIFAEGAETQVGVSMAWQPALSRAP